METATDGGNTPAPPQPGSTTSRTSRTRVPILAFIRASLFAHRVGPQLRKVGPGPVVWLERMRTWIGLGGPPRLRENIRGDRQTMLSKESFVNHKNWHHKN